jgi:hypothetical protein
MAVINPNQKEKAMIIVTRFVSDGESTLSTIYVNDRFVCFGLEDEFRLVKVMEETRIPAGTYKIKVRSFGGFHSRYGNKFGEMHRGMLEVADVPNFTDILIHIGNTHKDTAGCLLVGLGAVARPGDMSIQSSVEAYKALYRTVIEEALKEELSIHFVDADGKN